MQVAGSPCRETSDLLQGFARQQGAPVAFVATGIPHLVLCLRYLRTGEPTYEQPGKE
ncbi:MAG: hypothetical protein ACLQCU_01150 [Acidimicrobiales bacterium]